MRAKYYENELAQYLRPWNKGTTLNVCPTCDSGNQQPRGMITELVRSVVTLTD